MMNEIIENRLIGFLAGAFPRSPLQCNGLHEADAELVRLPGAGFTLALKADSIVEEIETGLYADPVTIGWMAVTSSISDLAAVGAQPLGIIISETVPARSEPSFLDALQSGIREACDTYGICVLGGDTNFSESMQITVFAVGIIPEGPLVKRIGCHLGDILFASGPLGLGSAFAFAKFTHPQTEGLQPPEFKPVARVGEGILVRKFASCCMDTSDGALATVDQLMRLNGVGFQLDLRDDCLHQSANSIAKSKGFPNWMMLAGPHGEFELIFTIPPDRIDEFLPAARESGWNPVRIGSVVENRRIEYLDDGAVRSLPTGKIRNLFTEVGGDVEKYIGALLKIAAGE